MISFFNRELSATEEMLRSAHFCDLARLKKSIANGADVNHENAAVLYDIIKSTCSTKVKKEIIDFLLHKGVMPDEINTLLALSVLRGERELISFCFDKVQDFSKEDLNLLYALQKNDCTTALKLLRAGFNITDELIEIADDTNIRHACTEIKQLQDVNLTLSTLSVKSSQIEGNIFDLEQAILSGHHLCSDINFSVFYILAP